MNIIVITAENFSEGESAKCTRLLQSGAADFLHVRKPRAKADEIAHLLEEIPENLREKIALHDHFELAEKFGIGGVHLNGRNPLAPKSFAGRISRSCHTLTELEAHLPQCDYCFLSPIFDSFSKKGYQSNFSENDLRQAKKSGIINSRCVALGGVAPSNFEKIRALGFGGGALLGYVWQTTGEADFENKINIIKKAK